MNYWGVTKTSLFNLVSFAPLVYQQVVRDSFKIYQTIAKVLKFQELFKNNFTNEDKVLNTFEESAVSILVGGGLAFQPYKQFRSKQRLSKTIKAKPLSNSKKFISKKIYSKTINDKEMIKY
ncbi:MAG: hypothetical protein LBU40_02350 [Methanobrevibacter sp.]|jgi:hypothetical protein|nr:hypothetical protein [Methanobrevibacter sp.]